MWHMHGFFFHPWSFSWSGRPNEAENRYMIGKKRGRSSLVVEPRRRRKKNFGECSLPFEISESQPWGIPLSSIKYSKVCVLERKLRPRGLLWLVRNSAADLFGLVRVVRLAIHTITATINILCMSSTSRPEHRSRTEHSYGALESHKQLTSKFDISLPNDQYDLSQQEFVGIRRQAPLFWKDPAESWIIDQEKVFEKRHDLIDKIWGLRFPRCYDIGAISLTSQAGEQASDIFVGGERLVSDELIGAQNGWPGVAGVKEQAGVVYSRRIFEVLLAA